MESHQLSELTGSLGARPILCVSLRVTSCVVVAVGSEENQPAQGVEG